MNVPLVAGVLGGIAVGAVAAYKPIVHLLHRQVDHRAHPTARSVVRHLHRPAYFAALLIALEVASVSLPLKGALSTVLAHVLGAGILIGVCWLALELTYVLSDVVLARYPLTTENNLRARRVQTQFEMLRRVTLVVVSVVGLALFLLSFKAVRAVGAGLLASAGLVALLAGIAVQPLASNLVAGIQIAVTQPIRTDDVVVISGHWGRIEEIHLTYVVVQVWDLRRLVLPISFFTSQPFENWTRSTADILGWVLIEVDYSAPVQAIRDEFNEIVAASTNWDGKVALLQVTNLGLTMQLRALMSSPDSSRSWDLQCEVREKLIAFLQQHYPSALPRLRTELAAPANGAADSSDGGAIRFEPGTKGPGN
ncbi:MAG: mechanosensitive ion channel [Actinomycetota bacterium]|nr:mechanosensitive ion channel [Actinomycetota bacterium]